MNFTSADDKLDRGDLDPDEADRLASLIRPEWEEEDAAAPAVAARAADREDEASATRIEPDRNVDVGDTLPTDMEPLLPKPAASRAAAPVAASATRMGLGTAEDEVTARPTAKAMAAAVGPVAAVAPAAAAVPAAVPPAAEVDEDLISTQARPIASVPPPAVASGAPSRRSAASMSRPTPVRIARAAEDEPIELPVQAGNLTTKIAVAVAAALAVALVAVLATRGDAPPPPTAVTTAAAPAPTPTLVPPPIPASIPDEPAAAATAASAKPSAAAPEPPAKDPPNEPSPAAETPKGPSKPPQGGAKPPPPGGGAKPPPKPPAGGIIRDAPF